MSVLPVGFGSSGGVDVGDITKSLRFRASGSTYMSRTPGSTTNRQKWLLNFKCKRGTLGTPQAIISAVGSSRVTYIYFNANNKLLIYSATSAGGGDGGEYISTRVFRDPTAWLDITIAYDSTQATAGNRIKAWVSNEQITAWDTATNPALNHDTQFNWTGVAMQIGTYNTSQFLDGYLARFSLTDAGAGDNATFGQLNTEINEWVTKTQSAVKAVVDAGGTNSFMLDFDDATSLTTLGYDKSSKGNNWTLNGFSLTAGTTYDHMLDVPGNSYATLNPIDRSITTNAPVPADGNLKYATASANTSWPGVKGSFALTSSKVYFEDEISSLGANSVALVGFADATTPSSGDMSSYFSNMIGLYIRNDSGTIGEAKMVFGTATSFGGGVDATNGTYMFAADFDAGKFWLGKAGTWYASGDPAAGTNPTGTFTAGREMTPVVIAHYGTTNGNSTHSLTFGQRPFAYTPPTGFKALCQANLPDVATSLLDPTDHHIDITVTKSGDTNFTLPWDADTYDTFFEIKRRDAAGDWYQIDGLRGYDKILKSNSNAAETTDANVLGISGTTGTLKSTLANGTYIVSATKAGLASARQTNTDGSITSTVSRNVDAGFSIVTYTGTAPTVGTVGHGLGAALSFWVCKPRGAADNWVCGHKALAVTEVIYLNSTSAKDPQPNVFNSTAPTSTVFSVGSNSNANATGGMVAYCYADSAIQKSFSYTGNNSTDGPNPFLGFKCGRTLLKAANSAFPWQVYDSARSTYNVCNAELEPNNSNAENGSAYPGLVDFTSNSLKIRDDDAGSYINKSTYPYIGHAWAATTGKYSLAR